MPTAPSATHNSQSAGNPQRSGPLRFGFLLLPNYSLIAFSSAIEPLRMANWVAGEELYQTCTFSDDGSPVVSSAAVMTAVDYSFDNLPPLDAVFVCGASPVAKTGNERVIAWLRRQDQGELALGGIGTASYLLACAGLLRGRRASIHWWDLDNLREEFPQTQVTNNLFEIDGRRYTCSGGTAAMDMMLFLIGKAQGQALAAAISEQFVCERIRSGNESQRMPLKARIGATQPLLIEAVTLMEANIEEPLTTDDLAFHVGVSRRHLERLFKKYLDTVPSKYYLELRMEKARQLLRQSNKPILQVALACGFTSASHFSTAYRSQFGSTPREDRKKIGLGGAGESSMGFSSLQRR